MDTIVKVGLGVFFGFVLIVLFRIAYVSFVVNQVTEMVNESSQKMIQKNQDRVQKLRDRQAVEQRLKEQTELAEKQELELQKAKTRVKESAWARYYKKPEECRSFKSEKHMVECGNIRVRARREFEKKWKDGKL